MSEFTEFERAKGNGQYETMVPLDEASAEIERLEKEVARVKAAYDQAKTDRDTFMVQSLTAWNDAIEAAAGTHEESGCCHASRYAADIRALKRSQE